MPIEIRPSSSTIYDGDAKVTHDGDDKEYKEGWEICTMFTKLVEHLLYSYYQKKILLSVALIIVQNK